MSGAGNGAMFNVSLSDDSEQGEVRSVMRQSSSMGSQFASTPSSTCSDDKITDDEAEEKARLICQVLELQNTLDDLSARVDGVKEENLKLKSENQVLGQYIENLMSASSVFQTTSPKSKKK
ncbi:short coiled-coil protein B-like [Saccoglossus kowalevskii]|uniref:Short coiled-coil protein A-like n=1 Tax=Saccoglossus kowalevskii TaxID=10224 RepID=A0ABM0GTG1_SACKO|nr:PREDICTED: short coiled-coil protein A-like [Saccoglossus kowalevskii]